MEWDIVEKTKLVLFVIAALARLTFADQDGDSNQDGWVVFDEFTSYYENEFKEKDVNKDGFLSQPEYRTSQFGDIDFNDDGKVDVDEYLDVQTYLYDVLDRDEDNRLSIGEISAAMKNARFYDLKKAEWGDPARINLRDAGKGQRFRSVTHIPSRYAVGEDAVPDPLFRPAWKIGERDSSSSGFALAPDKHGDLLKYDFGWEDRYYLIGHSTPGKDFPYVLLKPGQVVKVLFGVKEKPCSARWKLQVVLTGNDPGCGVLLKVSVNGKSWEGFIHPGKGSLTNSDSGQTRVLEFPVEDDVLRPGGNEVTLTILRGSWITFDQVSLQCTEAVDLVKPEKTFVRSVEPAEYEVLRDGVRCQPLLVEVEHLEAEPVLSVLLDGQPIFSSAIEEGNYIFEAPMPAVKSFGTGAYEIQLDGRTVEAGTVARAPRPLQTPADYVDTLIGSGGHSRWMIGPGPWMPFGMVKLAPDNKDSGGLGYDPLIESISCFSHIHEWTMAGLGIMPTAGTLETTPGPEDFPDDGYRSRIDKSSEKAGLGHYEVMLTDHGIKAELTATTRCGFQRHTFSGNDQSRVLIDLKIPCESRSVTRLGELEIRKVDDRRVEGFSRHIQHPAWGWGGSRQDYKVHFVVEFDRPIKRFGIWENDKMHDVDSIKLPRAHDAGAFVEFETDENKVVQVRSGISYVSIENAALNLETEISTPFGWDFDAVKNHNREVWNELLGRLDITTNDRGEKIRFYTNLYRAMSGRNIFSDVNGQWVDPSERIQQLPGKDDVALGGDALWNTFWNLNQLWYLASPEWASRWVRSQLALYRSHGWLAKGGAGMEYIPVMVAEHEIPLMVGAYQMGIRDYDAELAFEAVVKMQTTVPASYTDPRARKALGGGKAGNKDVEVYLAHKYVPCDKGKFSNSLEYSYDDWAVGQFAKALGRDRQYEMFNERGQWWKNVMDPESGYAWIKDSSGAWVRPFDPEKRGKMRHYTEGSAWQLTYFVPQDVPALIDTIGRDRFLARLEQGFRESAPYRYFPPGGDWVYHGNQQSMHFSFLFNWAGKPWLTQEWSRSILSRYYGRGVANAYIGQEDQGQMSAWFVMAAIGLFQTDGGCRTEPIYEIGSPLYEKVVIDLGERYGRGKQFTIEARNASRKNKYIQKAMLNGRELNTFYFPASDLLKGGSLILEMGDTPNKHWGVQ
jgi:predicted alpha-1,2-mannosidase